MEEKSLMRNLNKRPEFKVKTRKRDDGDQAFVRKKKKDKYRSQVVLRQDYLKQKREMEAEGSEKTLRFGSKRNSGAGSSSGGSQEKGRSDQKYRSHVVFGSPNELIMRDLER